MRGNHKLLLLHLQAVTVCCCCCITLVISSIWAWPCAACSAICATSTIFPFYFLLSYLSFCLAFVLWDILFIVLSSLLHLRLVLTASSALQSCLFLVWLDRFHACLSNVFCLGHQSQHFRGLREVLVCFLFYYPFSITVLLFHFYTLKRALSKYSYSEISMFPLFHPQKGIYYSIIAAPKFPIFLANCSSLAPNSICSFPTLFSSFLVLSDILS